MSRIEEALRRAAQNPATESRKGDPFTLGEYPRENPSAANPEPAPVQAERARPRPVAAPAAPIEMSMAHEPASVVREVPPIAVPRLESEPAKPLLSVSRPPVRLEAAAAAAPISPGLIRQCQRLAGVLHDRQAKQGLKTLAVMSAVGKEGKSAVAVSLAQALARTYSNRVLLIDRNLRHPSMHDLVGVPNSAGLSDLVRYHREVSPVGVSALLHLLPAGDSSPDLTEDLISARMRDILAESVGGYDWVLVDTPAMSVLDEAETVGRMTDGVVFVIGGSTPFPMVQQAITKLGRPRIVGTILNGVEDNPLGS